MLYRVVVLVRFSVLLGVVGGLVLIWNDQAQDVLHALGEDPDVRIAWFAAAAMISAYLAWWTARVIFFFRFRNPASAPHVFPRVKAYLPRILGASALGLIAVALFRASLSYSPWTSGPGGRLLLLSAFFAFGAGMFVYVTTKRRSWFVPTATATPSNLRSLQELAPRAWVPLAVTAVLGFGLMILFAYQAVVLGPQLGTAAVALTAVIGLLPVGSLFVYLGNRFQLPIVSLVLAWGLLSSYVADNHYIRLSAESTSHDVPPVRLAVRDADPSVGRYFEEWVDGLGPGADGSIPLFVVATEGGGVRAAYWTALVLGELHDRAAAAGYDFGRHVFAISGVSGGSLGAATFASLIANQNAGLLAQPRPGCPDGSEPAALGIRERAERILQRDFLAPAVAVMLFPDLLQQLVPVGFLNDRGVALERAWEAAWDACEDGQRFTQPFASLWSDRGVPLLFLNSTVVETGQRLIHSPVAIEEPAFSDALDGRRTLGSDVTLSTAVHNSARFAYVSPAGTARRRDRLTEIDGRPVSEWIRLVDGGYFENSAAVTTAEILRAVEHAAALRPPGAPRVRPVVLHLSNDPSTTDPRDLLEQRKLLNQPTAPIKALLNTRQARGFQAREDLAQRADAHLHFRVCSNREGSRAERYQPLPLGWALSSLARAEMRRQLGVLDDSSSDGDSIVRRNRENTNAVLALLAGSALPPKDWGDVWDCPKGPGIVTTVD